MADFWDSIATPTPAQQAFLNTNPVPLQPGQTLDINTGQPVGATTAPLPTATGTAFGAAPAPYAVDPTAAATLAQNYSAPQFTTPAPTFTAPTGVTYMNDPGAQYREDQVGQTVQRSAAAKGIVLNPGTVSALAQRVGDQATAEYQQVFNNANTGFQDNLATYGANYGVFQGNAAGAASADAANKTAAQATIQNGANQFSTNFNANETAQTDYWNRLMGVANTGAQAAAA